MSQFGRFGMEKNVARAENQTATIKSVPHRKTGLSKMYNFDKLYQNNEYWLKRRVRYVYRKRLPNSSRNNCLYLQGRRAI
jgi:hypothetical protein